MVGNLECHFETVRLKRVESNENDPQRLHINLSSFKKLKNEEFHFGNSIFLL